MKMGYAQWLRYQRRSPVSGALAATRTVAVAKANVYLRKKRLEPLLIDLAGDGLARFLDHPGTNLRIVPGAARSMPPE